MNASLLAFAALVPLAAGPLPEEAKVLTLALCGGGEMTLPLGDGAPRKRDCDPKACHAATCREKDRDRSLRQRI
ncbi:MAG: hypothetical protein V2I39_12265 [Erythrobacter sp.]|jgi:hypothetical protein|nr:hypothetical protein [Erythrobacter sp.]